MSDNADNSMYSRAPSLWVEGLEAMGYREAPIEAGRMYQTGAIVNEPGTKLILIGTVAK